MSPSPSTPARPPGARRAAAWRWGRRLLAVGVAVTAALILSFLTLDLGRIPGLKDAAERAASKYIERPMRIGKFEIWPAAGSYVLRDVVIDGLDGGRPFFQAKTITVKMSWRTLLHRQLLLDIGVHDWQVVMERWSNPDHHNIPNFFHKGKDTKPRPVTIRTVSHADRGTFIYEDHGTPWSVVAPNLTFDMVWSLVEQRYVGTASFAKGTVQIQDYLPMSADMTTRFWMEGGKVTLPHIDLKTDGADSHVTGRLDFNNWPEQSYAVNSDLDFGRMKELFFSKESWKVGGRGHFAGVFNIYHDARGRDLSGDFTSPLATVNGYRFPNLHGSLVWLPDRFAVTHADADFAGGDMRFAYAVEPLGSPAGSTQKFAADVERIDLKQLKQLFDFKSIELAGQARGRVAMAWPSGHMKDGVSGTGELTAVPPAGVTLATAELPARLAYTRTASVAPHKPNETWPPLGPLPVGGALAFRFDPEGATFHESTIATPTTFVALQGRTTYDGAADFPFHVTSRDWQESDRLLAAIITAASGSASNPVEVGGVGTFDGRMTGSFKAPRVEGCFSGDEMYAWGVTWGHGDGDVIILDKYLDLANGRITRGDSTIRANGRFALGFPRADGGEEIHAKISLKSWPLDDLSLAFGKSDWPIHGLVAESTLDLHGKYDNALLGGGTLKVVQGEAWHERFDVASGDLVFNGPTVEIQRIQVTKGTGVLKGTASLGWDSIYSFDVVGERIAIESLDNFKLPQAPLSGVMSLTCSGVGSFDRPSYRCHADAPDLSAGDQVIGQTRADIVVEQGILQIDRLDATSNRLQVFTTGQINLSAPYQSTFSATFQDTSIDPFMKFVMPSKKWSDLVHAVVFGNVTASGPLQDPPAMQLKAKITQGTLSLYEYELRNQGPIEFTIKDRALTIGQAKLEGKDTEVLEISGGFADSKADFRLKGKVNLAILKSPGLVTVSSGNAILDATLKGSLDAPQLTGAATIENGVFRYGTLPSLTDISGQAKFDDKGINADGLTAKIGTGQVAFGGNVSVDLNEFKNSEYDLTATGRGMVVRYPEGFQSKVDANLTLTGPVMSPTLGGDVTVLSASYVKRFDTDAAAILGLAGSADSALAVPAVQSSDEGVKLNTDVHIIAPPSSLLIDNGSGTHIEASGHLDYRAEGDRATLLGRIEIDRGTVNWNTNKFTIQSGAIGFDNPAKIEPNFDIAANVRPHAPGQTFDVGIRINGTTSKLNLNLSSDPWLSQADIIRLLLGETPDQKSVAEIRSFQTSQEASQLMQAAAAQILLSPISSRVVGSVIGEIPFAPTVFLAPVLGTDISTTAAARLVVGKKISSKAYLSYTYTRALNTAFEQEFFLLEYEVSDRVTWIVSRNEDRSYALDFRIRHVF